MRFAGPLLQRSILDRRLVELVVLRVASNCSCDYEWGHHVPLAVDAGVTLAEVARIRQADVSPSWNERDAATLTAADELHSARRISDDTWARLLAAGLSNQELIELCMLVGQYEMLSMTILSAGVETEAGIVRLPPR
jgi:alkylhydroperoxidase family enzyme